MDASLGPTRDDLAQVYQTPDPRLAGHGQAEGVVVDATGITVLCSANPTGEGEQTRLMQLADDGSLRWEQHYTPGHGAGRAIAALSDGGFVIAGDVRRGVMDYQAQLLRVAADGTVTASGAFGPRGATGFVAVVVLDDGSTLAGGMAHGKGWVVQADEALRARWDLPLDDVDDVDGLAALPDGGFALAAGQDGSTTALGMTRLAAFTADRRVRWQKQLPTAGRAEPAALAMLPDGSLVVAGHHVASERDAARLWVAQVDPRGEVAWERLLGAADEERRGRAIAPLADGGVAVASEALRDGHRGLRVARLAADGTVAWDRAYGGGGGAYSMARGLARSGDGGLALAGSTMAQGRGKTTVRVLRLDGDGRLLWDRVLGPS